MQNLELRTYLLNMAETLQHVLLPALSGTPQGRAQDCLNTLARITVALEGDADASIAAEPATADPSISAALREGLAHEAADARAVELIRQITQSAPPPGRSVDTARLQAYLRAHALGGPELTIVEARLLPGGRSKQTILVRQSGARGLPADIVIRQDWARSVVGSAVVSEFEVLQRLHRAGLRVPQPLLIEASAAPLDAPFLVVTRLPGKVDGDLFTPPSRPGPVLEFAEQMARFHALPVAEFEPLPGIVESNYTQEQLKNSLQKFRSIIDSLDRPRSALVAAALDWLDTTLPRVQGPRTLVHGDIGFHNNLCDGEHLSAVLDWELAHIGSPALDLGYVKSAVEDAMAWPDFMARYRAAGGPAISDFSVDWYSLFTTVWFYHMMLQARAGLMAGVLHDMEISFVCAHFGPAALARISRKLASALARYA